MTGREATANAWYTEDGPDNDVILSSRVRVARNLAGFPFPAAIKSDDAESILSLVFDAFNQLENPERFQLVRMADLDILGRRILSERGVISPGVGNDPWRGIVIRNDGIVSATINVDDHLRLAAFSSGLALFPCARTVSEIERAMESRLQFSAQAGFGYLTANLLDAGSGLKASVLACLPSLCMGGLLDRVIREYLGQGFIIRGYYGSDAGTSLGCLYQLSNGSSASGDAESQLAQMERAAVGLAELERKARREVFATMPLTVEDSVFRAIAAAKYARFIPLPEAVDLIQRIKLGLTLGLVTGFGHKDLTALLYRIQSAHIGFVISGGDVTIEEDVRTEDAKADRLRAMVIQEVLKAADIRERR